SGDDGGHSLRGIGGIVQGQGGSAHLLQSGPVIHQRQDRLLDGGAAEVGVVDHQRGAGPDAAGRVEPLLSVADRQGHVECRHTGHAGFGDGGGTGAGDEEVGDGIGPVHAVDVVDDVVVRQRLGGRAELIALAGTGDVQDLDFRVLETGGGVEEGFVDPLGSGGSAGDDE